MILLSSLNIEAQCDLKGFEIVESPELRSVEDTTFSKFGRENEIDSNSYYITFYNYHHSTFYNIIKLEHDSMRIFEYYKNLTYNTKCIPNSYTGIENINTFYQISKPHLSNKYCKVITVYKGRQIKSRLFFYNVEWTLDDVPRFVEIESFMLFFDYLKKEYYAL